MLPSLPLGSRHSRVCQETCPHTCTCMYIHASDDVPSDFTAHGSSRDSCRTIILKLHWSSLLFLQNISATNTVRWTRSPPEQFPNKQLVTITMRGDAPITKVHYQGNSDDFIVYAESAKAVQDWKQDSSIPLAQVVSSFKIFVSHK